MDFHTARAMALVSQQRRINASAQVLAVPGNGRQLSASAALGNWNSISTTMPCYLTGTQFDNLGRHKKIGKDTCRP